ncbi:MAG: ATPase [Gammaproteobacteria bacterium]|nr:ATPase [Gammaproteobacteria bacterium]
MKLSGEQFINWDKKAITLLGMSGVGKTRLACLLRKRNWFHYSCDYRIGTRYMDEVILDNIKSSAMQIPILRELLLSDSIHIINNITVDNLKALSTYLGKLGNPEQGGIGIREFKEHQRQHRDAEIAAMNDVPRFIRKAHEVYGYDHFINDASGSLCELDDNEVLSNLAKHTLIIYIQATSTDEKALIHRAEADPKPLYYREEFLDTKLQEYMQQQTLEYAAQIVPDEFVRWVFPRLFYERIPRYEAIAGKYGYTVSTKEIETVQTEEDFLDVISAALDSQH